MVSNKMNYGIKMKELREYDETKQITIAKTLKISASAYQQFESQKRIIPLKHLNDFCNLFNVSIDYLFGLTIKEKYRKSKKELSYNIFIKRLNEIRKEKKLSQKALAIKVGIPRTTLENYETGKTNISTKSLYLICQKCNVSADYLLGKTDNPKHL